jgi:hypothetical protein
MQPETLKISSPMILLLRSRNWKTYKTHGSQYQAGFPDHYIIHPIYAPRWVEFKIKDISGNVHLTPAQKIVFPEFLANNVPLYIIADYDLRGNRSRLEFHYSKLLQEPNGFYALTKKGMQLL